MLWENVAYLVHDDRRLAAWRELERRAGRREDPHGLRSRRGSLALESNGLRALLRLGLRREGTSCAASYRSVTAALADELPASAIERLAAHQLLRTLGQSLCTRSSPDCDARPLARRCPSAPG